MEKTNSFSARILSVALLVMVVAISTFTPLSAGVAQIPTDLPVSPPLAEPVLTPQPQYRASDPLKDGQEHNYTVLFRNNGEAVVEARLKVVNNSNEPMSRVFFKTPKTALTSVRAWQYANSSKCRILSDGRRVPCVFAQESKPLARYEGCYTDKSNRALPNRLDVSPVTVENCVEAGKAAGFKYVGLQNGTECYAGNSIGYTQTSIYNCNKYCGGTGDLKCGGFWYNSIYRIEPGGVATSMIYEEVSEKGWFQLESASADNVLLLPLYEIVSPGEQAEITVRYRASGYVSKGIFGRRVFDIHNLIADTEIRQVNFTINVDTDLYLKGKKSSVSFNSESFSYLPQGGLGLDEATSKPQMLGLGYDGNYSKSGRLTKSSQFLAAGEKFHVKGVYASSWFGLRSPYLFLVFLTLGLLIFGVVQWRRRHPRLGEGGSKPTGAKDLEFNGSRRFSTRTWGILGGAFFALTAAAIVLIWVFFVNNIIDSIDYKLRTAVGLAGLFSSFIIALAAFSLIPVYNGLYGGIKKGLATLGWQILSLIIYFAIFMFIAMLV